MKGTHVSADDLFALRTGRLASDRLADVLDHVAGCPECRAAASKRFPIDHAGQELLASVLREDDPSEVPVAAFAETSPARSRGATVTSARDVFFRPATAIAASLIVVIGAAFWIRSRAPQPLPRRVTQATTRSAVTPASPSRRSEIDAIAARGVIEPPPAWLSLQIGDVTFRGDAVTSTTAFMRPYRDIVSDTRPSFRWAAPTGATSVVSIYDGPELVTSSGVLTSRQWTADRELKPGHSYLWQLEVRRKGERIILPPPSEPVARFVIADAQTRARLEAARNADPNDHLGLGILAALAGMQDEAERELEAVTPAAPQYRAAHALLASVKGWSRRAGGAQEVIPAQ
jgi:anti-sigma factor RsiW